MNEITKIKIIFYSPILILILILFSLILNIIISDIKIKDNPICHNVYLGICFDNSSQFYKCSVNLENGTCDNKIWEQVSTIKFMEDNKIQIYGVNTCPHCIEQKKEFGDFIHYMELKHMYIDCGDKSNIWLCKDVEYTPTWKVNKKIIIAGYIPLQYIVPAFSKLNITK